MADEQREPASERERLLNLAAQHVLHHGVASVTLRELARAVGSNNRMLLYYFGSTEELIIAAARRAIAGSPTLTASLDLLTDTSVPLDERLIGVWRVIADPSNLPHDRLFFELFGLAAHAPGRYGRYLTITGTEWASRVAAALAAEGLPGPRAMLYAREVVALWRGLQMELLAEESPGSVDEVAWSALSACGNRIRAEVQAGPPDRHSPALDSRH